MLTGSTEQQSVVKLYGLNMTATAFSSYVKYGGHSLKSARFTEGFT